MSSKAFGLTAYYDSMIADWFNTKLKIKFQKEKRYLEDDCELRYGKILINKVLYT